MLKQQAVSDPAAAEQRRAPRERAMLSARLTWGRGTYSLEATVTQISKTGCQLAVLASHVLPPEFQIDVPRRAISRKALVVWRTQQELAVRFIDADAAPAAITQTLYDDKLRRFVEQIGQLKAENEVLRREIAKLRGGSSA